MGNYLNKPHIQLDKNFSPVNLLRNIKSNINNISILIKLFQDEQNIVLFKTFIEKSNNHVFLFTSHEFFKLCDFALENNYDI